MIVHELAEFVGKVNFKKLSIEETNQLKKRLLDSLGTAIGAIEGRPVRALRSHLDELGGNPISTLIGGSKSSPDRAALYNSALVRYLDYNDSYLAKGETCHPSDNIGAILAAGEHANISGEEFLTALAIAYQVQCRLSDEAPVRDKGFDHTTQGSYSVAAGVSKALGLSNDQTANALAIAGTSLNALRVSRTGALSNWKGFAFPHTAFGATHACYLARQGITGPESVFEGNKGFMDSIAGQFKIDWKKEGTDKVLGTIIKKYNAEIHSQSTLEGVLQLKDEKDIQPGEIDEINIEIFDVAYHIIGGGEEGDKTIVRNKEEADHSLNYLVSAALLDDQVMPEQYEQARIEREDIQNLLKKVHVTENQEYSDRFPDEMPVKITIRMNNGRVFEKEKSDYEGFHTRPAGWDTLVDKFHDLAEPRTSPELREKIIEMIQQFEEHTVTELFELLEKVELKTDQKQ
ncbi:MAG TPA: MmgE/PrpD family protein [Balneolaceae bacterium]|nr:MmgE/PrpD family protein [Balneolaceae bacterium]